jgi:hypothetical protein
VLPAQRIETPERLAVHAQGENERSGGVLHPARRADRLRT